MNRVLTDNKVSLELLRRIAARKPNGSSWHAHALLRTWWSHQFPRRHGGAERDVAEVLGISSDGSGKIVPLRPAIK
jgi:hypothetical protein